MPMPPMPTPTPIPTLFGRATAILGEHSNLGLIIDQLRELCAGLSDGETQLTADRQQLIETFRDNLYAHFAAEEDDGYFGTLVTTLPALGAEVVRLRLEHEVFRLDIQRLIGLSASADGLEEFAVTLSGLLDRFKEHERAENLLLQEFFLRDEGDAGD